jgi:uncharacterized OsmC-like protein
MNDSNIRQYDIEAQSTDTFGRVLCACRNHHFVSDGPIQNGCPGEAITPAELFLSGVAACGVELLQVISKEKGIPLRAVRVSATGLMDRSHPVRPDVSLFNSVRFRFALDGVTEKQGQELIGAFKGR